MSVSRRTAWRTAIASMTMVASATTVALATAGPAHADPGCQNGGVYVIWARGSDQKIGNDGETRQFRENIESSLNVAGVSTHAWAELGNLDGSRHAGEDPDQPDEYPASPVPWSNLTGQYNTSVFIGVTELIAHLNHRYTPGPVGMGCMSETAILGGYSQGADVLGWALALTNGNLFGYPIPTLTPEARSHIGFAALYGDPKFNVACGQNRPWVRGNARCDSTPRLQPPRAPYLPSDFLTRTGSWCDDGDGICAVNFWTIGIGNHTSIYRNQWIQQSAAEIAAAARLKRCSLTLACPSGGASTITPPPPPNTDPFGTLDEVGTVVDQAKIFVRGWAIDPDTTNAIMVHTYVDGVLVGATTANTSRPDVGAAFPGSGNSHGYYAEYAVGIGSHQVCTYAVNVGSGSVNSQLPSCKTVQVSLAPASFQRSNGETVVVAVGPNHRLDFYYNPFGSTTFNRLAVTADNMAYSTPTVIERPNGETDIVVVGPNNRLDFYYNVFGSSTFTRLAVTGDNMAFSVPAIVQRPNGESDIVVLGSSNSLDFYYNPFGTSSFNRLTAGPNTAYAAPAIIQRSNGESDMVVQGPNNRLDFYYNPFGTSQFNRLVVAGDNMVYSTPMIVQRSNSESDVVVRGPDNSLDFYYNVFGQPNFTRLTAGPNTAFSAPAVIQRANGESDMAVVGPNNRLDFYYNALGSSTFTRLAVNGDNTANAGPVIMQRGNGESDIVTAGPGTNYDFYYNPFGTSTWGHVPVAG